MKTKTQLISCLAAVAVIGGGILAAVSCSSQAGQAMARPEGPCDVYAQGGTPCASAHSTTRALLASYSGPLYQIMRQSDGAAMDIGVVPASANDAGGYADAEAQDRFCADTYCWITVIYDQVGDNDLYQAPRGGFSGPSMGGFNNIPLADWAPVTLMGHKVYGVFIAPGMGMRWNDTKGIAVDDQAEGQYWVINGQHYNDGCCFDYGNAETDSRDDGDGTMETTYYGNSTGWYYGNEPGPWIMTDQENNLVGCVNDDPSDKYCPTLNAVTWRFVTAMADGEPHHWRSMGGNAQEGDLLVYYDGGRIRNDRSSYDPMRKQGAILLGNGGDNSVGSAGTFYEGAITVPGSFPTKEINQAVQANVVAAGYDVQRLGISGADNVDTPNGLQTFAPGQTQKSIVKFVNTTSSEISDLSITVQAPSGWKVSSEAGGRTAKVGYTVAPGQTVVVSFDITSSSRSVNADLVAKASFTADGVSYNERAVEKVRNVSPIKINEFRIADAKGNQTNSFIELYNASDSEVDISGWSVTEHAINLPIFSSIDIPAGTRIAPNGFYLLGLASSGLSVQAQKGDKVIYVRTLDGISVGDSIMIGDETRTVAAMGRPEIPETFNAAGMRMPAPAMGIPTKLWQPLPEGPVITVPAGSTNIPVTSTTGFQPGQKMAIGYGATYPTVSDKIEKYEVVTVTEVGKPGTQAYLSMDAKAGDTNIKVSSTANITAGDRIRLDIDSQGHGIETVTVKSVGTPSVRNTFRGPLGPDEDPGTGLELEAPLKFDHASNMPFSVNGTGISFEPATKFAHSSNEPVLALVYSIELDEALSKDHPIDEAVVDAAVTTAGYNDEVPADLLFGGPALSASKGNITLRDASGNIADAVNYGGVVDPWLGEGYHAESGHGLGGSFARVASQGGRNAVVTAHNLSTGRFPDGADLDDNKKDFRLQTSLTLSGAAEAGSTNIKVSSVGNLAAGRTLWIGRGETLEQVTVTEVGTPGGTVLATPAYAGAKKLSVASIQGFSAGQKIVIGDAEYTIESIQPAPRRWTPTPMQPVIFDTLILADALRSGAPAGASVAGTGLTLSAPISNSHRSGESVTDNLPTPGRPNQY